MTERVLIVDDDSPAVEDLVNRFRAAGVSVDTASDGLSAIEKLGQAEYSAVILDPMIRHGLNGYVVLDFIEQEKPEVLEHLFLLTGMSKETIARTAPTVLPRTFRKPCDQMALANAVLGLAGSTPSATANSRHLPLLIVEDDPITATTLAALVEEFGYSASIVHGGHEALRRISSCDYAAIMLDLIMPDLDGFAILEQMKRTRPELLHRVIVTTGMPNRYASSLDRDDICAVVHKPVDIRELASALQRCAGDTVAPLDAVR